MKPSSTHSFIQRVFRILGFHRSFSNRTTMADSEATQPANMAAAMRKVDDDEKRLKHLDFVQMAAIYIISCLSTVYECAKENSGPLKSGVQTVEDTVKTVIGPVSEKFHDVPFELLGFIDRKVDKSLGKFDRRVPTPIKQALSQAITLAQKAPEAARAVASEVRSAGVMDAAANISKIVYDKYEPTAKELYSKFEPVAEQYAVSAWRWLNRLPLFPQAARIVVPMAAYWSKKYNQTVRSKLGHPVTVYLPLIPIDRICKVLEEAETESEPTLSSGGECVTVEQ